MDLPLFTDPSNKPWLNIVANSYIITGDGSFGWDGVLRPVTGGAVVNAFGFAPKARPVVAANSYSVGTTFSGVLTGSVSSVGDNILVNIMFGFSIAAQFFMSIPAIPIGFPANIRIAFSFNFAGLGVLALCQNSFTVTIARQDGIFENVEQIGVGLPVDTTVDSPVSINAIWQTTNVNNSLTFNGGWMRRVI